VRISCGGIFDPIKPIEPEIPIPNLYTQVVHLRNALGPPTHWPSKEELGWLLNTFAYNNRHLGVGLSAKPGGTHILQPHTGIRIAEDIIHFKEQNVLIDCLVAAGERAEPSWFIVDHHNDPNRPWIPPVKP
jgi:hypothetical protein